MPDDPAPAAAQPEAAAPSARRRLLTRRRFLAACAGGLATTGGTYLYGREIGTSELTVEHVRVTIPGLAARWRGKRIVHLADFHAGPRVDRALIVRGMQMALDLNPALILVTGDWVDSNMTHADDLAAALKPVVPRVPVIGSLGNHDFAQGGPDSPLAAKVTRYLRRRGVIMLRNQMHALGNGPGELALVGLDDLYSGGMDPAAIAAAPPDAAVIVLTHNPDTYEYISHYRWHLALAGHTHGGQVVIPGIGPLILPVRHKERAAGLFHLDPALPHRALYVTRGVGHLLKIRLFCPPEVTCIELA